MLFIKKWITRELILYFALCLLWRALAFLLFANQWYILYQLPKIATAAPPLQAAVYRQLVQWMPGKRVHPDGKNGPSHKTVLYSCATEKWGERRLFSCYVDNDYSTFSLHNGIAVWHENALLLPPQRKVQTTFHKRINGTIRRLKNVQIYTSNVIALPSQGPGQFFNFFSGGIVVQLKKLRLF